MNIVEPIRDKKIIKQVEKILQASSQRNLLMFVMGTNSGLSISNILGLNIGDVRNKAHIAVVEKKTGKHKKFPINIKLKAMIDNFIEGKSGDEPLFKTRFNGRLDRFQAYKIVNG